jgi:hypothetical protein
MDKQLISTLAIALLASAGWCASALAQDKAAPAASAANADKTQVVPGKKDLNPYPATVEKMDDNAQRIHDRDSAAGRQGTSAAGQQARAPSAAVRDWAAIDKNKDNLISPEEMEAALKESWQSSASANTVPAKK